MDIKTFTGERQIFTLAIRGKKLLQAEHDVTWQVGKDESV